MLGTKMALERKLEPEVMDTAEEASTYDAMDHSEVNRRFVEDLLLAMQPHGEVTRVLDLGTGTALIPIEFCRQHATARIVAADLAEHMLEVARTNIQRAELQDRIELVHLDAKEMQFADREFPIVMSNSIVHHIPEPISVLKEAARIADRAIFFRDLMRPDTEQQLADLVEIYAGTESEHAKSMFDDSLRAALSLDEMRNLAVSLGFSADSVKASSDRHWTWFAPIG